MRLSHTVCLVLVLASGCAAHKGWEHEWVKPGSEQATCDAMYAFFGSPSDMESRPAVKALIGSSPAEIEARFGEPTSRSTAQQDPDFSGMEYFLALCPANASAPEKQRWRSGYHYVVEFAFHRSALTECRVAWPRVYDLKQGVVK
jgi:hypothetical protein